MKRMATFNQCQFIGRLGKDPEMSYTPTGKPVTKFSLAVDQGKDQKPLWLNIVCWNELAERMNMYLSKGLLVFVQGRLVQRSYQDKNKVERVAIEIIASTVQMLEKGKQPMPSDESTEDVPF
jgi:single-strand DNA-binding protein